MLHNAFIPVIIGTVFFLCPLVAQANEAPKLIAHRGASAEAPENTMAAFQLAWKEGADGVEADFRLSADGHVVCIHDSNTKKTGSAHLEVGKSYARVFGD